VQESAAADGPPADVCDQMRAAGLDVEFLTQHVDPYDPTFAEQIEAASPYLSAGCPVVHSDRNRGLWMVYDYENASRVWRDWETFSSNPDKYMYFRDTKPVELPIDLDPPLQRAYRKLLNPYFTPARASAFEPAVRQLVSGLIDDFIEAGECDLVSQFAREFPGRMLFRHLFDVDADEVTKCQVWTRYITEHPKDPNAREYELAWVAWIRDLITRRRMAPRRDNVIDALIFGEVDGQAMSEDEIVGTIVLLILGGFGTTADLIANSMYRLAADEDLQSTLRQDPSLIPQATDEFLRHDPPITVLSRVCTRDTEVGGRQIKAGERVAVSFTAANRDSAQFDDPSEIKLGRNPNRHLAFGLGNHRCIGSNIARLNFRISLEELLRRLDPFRLQVGFVPKRAPGQLWELTSLPLEFPPRSREHATDASDVTRLDGSGHPGVGRVS
jgi:cytochrome P450